MVHRSFESGFGRIENSTINEQEGGASEQAAVAAEGRLAGEARDEGREAVAVGADDLVDERAALEGKERRDGADAERRAEVLQRSGLNTIYGYQVLSGKRRPSRDVLLCLCLGLRMQPEQVQTLLKSTGYAPLYVKNRRDSAIYYALSHGQDAVTLNQMLFDLEEATLL